MDHENEFRGSKNGGREVWVGLYRPKNAEKWLPKVAVALAFAGSIWARPVAVRREISRPGSSHLAPPPCPASVQGGWPELPPTAET